jgi:hypothetical protein
MTCDDPLCIDLTDDGCDQSWAWIEDFRVSWGVPTTVEDPVLLANLAQALLTHAGATPAVPG